MRFKKSFLLLPFIAIDQGSMADEKREGGGQKDSWLNKSKIPCYFTAQTACSMDELAQ